MTLEVLPVRGIGDVRPGDDLAALIATAAPWLADGDVLVVTSKVVSKAEGRLVAVPPEAGPDREKAREAAIDDETVRVVARRGPTRIVQTRHGLVLAAAGVDESNVDRSHVVLLPEDPDASARALREAFGARFGIEPGVIVSDSFGRAWRQGTTDVAIGVAGLAPLLDLRGTADARGRPLEATVIAVADELAGAAELVLGKADGVPGARIRGLRLPPGDGSARELVMPPERDLFP